MLKQLEIRNIGRVDHEIIDFDLMQRVIGENNAGKTLCIYETLEIALFGLTLPESMIRNGEKTGYIKVGFTDGRIMERWRTGAKQTGKMTWPDGREKEFATIKDMEEEIQAFTGFRFITVEKAIGKESFQFIAIDAPQNELLLKQDPDTAMRRITKIVGGTGPETAKQKLEAEARKLNGEKTAWAKVFDELSGRIEKVWSQVDVEYLEELHGKLELAEKTIIRIQDREVKIAHLWSEFCRLDYFTQQIAQVYKADEVDTMLTELRALEQRMRDLDAQANRVKLLQAKRARLLRASDPRVAQHSTNAGKLLEQAMEQKALTIELNQKIRQITDACTRSATLSNDLERLERQQAEVQKLIDEWVPAEPICPTCGRPTEQKEMAKAA